jgi:hypothetical protein
MAAIQGYADGSGSDLLKWVIGSTGNQLLYPSSGAASKTRDTGSLWTTSIITTIIKYLCDEMDVLFGSAIWASIDTGASGVAPTLNGGVGVVSAAKDEAFNTLTVNFTTSFANATYYFHALIVGQYSVLYIATINAGSIVVQFEDKDGVAIDIDKCTVLAYACGVTL